MTEAGELYVVGLGPGPEGWLTPAARDAIDKASDIFGYDAYVSRLHSRADQRVHGSGNRLEISRARAALERAAEGATVALVSGGDPGVFAMAAAVFEALEEGPPGWRALRVVVEPGITAMLAAAARIGAPLGGDFCAISLSDNLKPWDLIERRLKLAAEADFVIALYNPASIARPHGIKKVFEVLRAGKAPHTPVVLARAVGRPDEAMEVAELASAEAAKIDMQTLVIVGASATRVIVRPGGEIPWVYTPRSIRPL